MSTIDTEDHAQYRGNDHRIMVGVDGSDESINALRWAVAEASRTGARVEAVYVYANPSETTWYVGGYPGVLPPDGETVIRSARNELDRAVRRAIETSEYPSLTTLVVPHRSPAEGLTSLATHADLLVIGAHHASGLGRLFGSTAAAVLRHAACPVVVVPSTDGTPTDSARSEQVVTSGAER